MRVSDLNLEARKLYIRREVSKTRVSRTLILSPFTVQAIAKFVRHGGMMKYLSLQQKMGNH
ncbi:hypothetical protein [Caldanaerobacter sp.]|uniref:hypothetical protein n=1 Tax=Caldanaerobacter sp. TaxID=2930036 RepID=UPI003C745852